MALIGDNAIEIEPVETENIGSLAQLAVSQLPGCDDLILRQQLGFALREFCRETDACVMEMSFRYLDGASMPNGLRGFPVAGAPSGMDIGTVLDVKIAHRSVPFEVFDGPAPMVVPQRWYCERDHVMVLFSLVPKVGGEACPRWFKERYAEAIVAGALFHMMSMRGRPWADEQRASQCLAEYQNAIADAAYRRLKGCALDGGPESAVPSGGLFM